MRKKYLKNPNINLKVMSDKNRSEIKFLVELDENRARKTVVVCARWIELSEASDHVVGLG
jgi:hypothetical protein